VLQCLVFIGSRHALQILVIPHGLKVSAYQEEVNLIVILPFKLLDVFVDIVEFSMAATLNSDLNGLLAIKEGIVIREIWDLLSWCELVLLFSVLNLSAMDGHPNREAEGDAFISTILKPGSSLHPTFLIIVDAAFLCLLLVLVTLVFLTAQNPHIFALIIIEFCLWGSVKW